MDNDTKKAVVAILKEAIELEKEGELYYRKAAGEASDKYSTALLLRLAEDEVEHNRMILEKLTGVESDQDALFEDGESLTEMASQRLRIFPNDPEVIKKEVVANERDLNVLKVAIEKEKAAVRLYSEAAEKCGDGQVKSFFNYLVEMEKMHEYLLNDYHAFLTEPTAGWDNMERWACQS